MAIDYYQQQFGEDDYEDSAPAALATRSDDQILAFVQANIDNPALIAETAAQYGVSVADLSRVLVMEKTLLLVIFNKLKLLPLLTRPLLL